MALFLILYFFVFHGFSALQIPRFAAPVSVEVRVKTVDDDAPVFRVQPVIIRPRLACLTAHQDS